MSDSNPNKVSTPSTPASPAKSTTPTVVDPNIMLAELMKQVAELKVAQANQEKASNAQLAAKLDPAQKPKEIDWSKVKETEIFNMDIPVPTIEHSLATYLDVQLLDQNYVARWVHTKRHNLGPRIKLGWRFVAKEDLDPNFPHALDFDTSGHYSFDDVVCMMIPKSVYFGKLKQNFNRATTIQRKKEVKAPKGDIPGISDELPVQAALERGAMEFYEPSAPKQNIEQI